MAQIIAKIGTMGSRAIAKASAPSSPKRSCSQTANPRPRT